MLIDTIFGLDVCEEIAKLLDELFGWLRGLLGELLGIEL